MLDAMKWMEELQEKLLAAFGERLCFLGLQGSYQRGEATEQSDIDVMAVIDGMTFGDLALYRETVRTMPQSELACGFICGKEELQSWPKYELFQLRRETRPLLGDLEALLPPVETEDVRDSVRISAGGLYHEICHQYIYGEQKAETLRGSYKGSFFILQNLHYLRTGTYIHTRRALCDALTGPEQEILKRSLCWEAYAEDRRQNPDGWFQLLQEWCARTLEEMNGGRIWATGAE